MMSQAELVHLFQQKEIDVKVIEQILEERHEESPRHVVKGRNIAAGYIRGTGIALGALTNMVSKDSLFQEVWRQIRPYTLLPDSHLINLFLIMKYGLQGRSGDIIECGSYYGGGALFLAHLAQYFGIKGTIYALDTFQGMPMSDIQLDFHMQGQFTEASLEKLEALIQEQKISNLIPVAGLFEESLPTILAQSRPILLAHIDCDIYSSVKYVITELQPHMDQKGGYFVFDDALNPSCIGAMQPVEELLQHKGFRAEQAYPHLVYRFPKLKN